MNSLKPLNEQATKRCSDCKKVFVFDKGFDLTPTGKYKRSCKKCNKEIKKKADKKYAEKNRSNNYHKWGDEINNISKCTRCGLERKKTPYWKYNQWLYRYYVNFKWVKEIPKCK